MKGALTDGSCEDVGSPCFTTPMGFSARKLLDKVFFLIMKMEVLTDESKLYFVFGKEQSMLLPDPVKMSAIFLPGLLAGPKILKEMKKKIERELDRNCGRLRTDYSDRIYESARCFQKDFMGKYASAVEGTAAALNRAVIKREKSEIEVNEYMVKLNEQKDLLENVRQRLKEVLEKIKI